MEPLACCITFKQDMLRRLLILILVGISVHGCPESSSCFRNRLSICCNHANMSGLPHGTNTTLYLEVKGHNFSELTVHSFQIHNLHGLITLKIKRAGLSTIQPGAFQNMSQLRSLDLCCNDLETIPRGAFQGAILLSHLDLSFNEISKLSSRAFEGLYLIRHLDISFNDLTSIPGDVFHGMMSENLTGAISSIAFMKPSGKLDLSFNGILYLEPGTFENLSMFSELEIRLKELEENGLSGLRILKLLILSRVEILHSKAFTGLSLLKELTLKMIQFRYIETDIFYGLSQLQKLNIMDLMNDDIDLILEDGAFSRLDALTALRLDYLRIRNINTNTFKGLFNLRFLSMTRNKIKILPKNAFLQSLKLVELNLEENSLVTIGEGAFNGLHRLTKLNLRSNILKTIEEGAFNGLYSLRQLNLEANELETIEEGAFNGLHRLSQVNLRSNKLKYMENGSLSYIAKALLNVIELSVDTSVLDLLYNMSLLKKLYLLGDLDKTTLSRVRSLQLEHLKVWNSSKRVAIRYFNHFTALTYLEIILSYVSDIILGDFSPLSNLEEFKCIECKIKSLEPGVFRGPEKLKAINLNRNELTELQEGVFGSSSRSNESSEGLVSLEILFLSRNSIVKIQLNTFRGCVNLKFLDLSENRLTTLEYEVETRYMQSVRMSVLGHLTSLEKLYLDSNVFQEMPLWNFKQVKNLNILSFDFTSLVCDCGVKEFWLGLRSYHVYLLGSLECNGTDWDDVLPSLNCTRPLLSKTHPLSENSSGIVLQKYVAPSLLMFIFITGLVGNVLLFFIFVLNPDMRTGHNVYIVNLTCADVLNLVINLPLSYVDSISSAWELGDVMCKVFMYVRDFAVGVSVFSVTALALQRFVAIVHSVKRKKGIFGFPRIFQIGAVWLLSAVLAIPSLLSATLLGDRCLNASPEYGREYMRTVWTAQLIVYCGLPMAIISFLYFRMALHLRRSVAEMPGETQATIQKQGRTRVAGMVVALTAVFCVSQVPNFLVRVLVAWSVLDSRSSTTLYISFVSYCLFFSNTCFNPLALYLMSSKYRRLFKKYIFFWR